MSQTVTSTESDDGEEESLRAFLEERREVLETVADGEYAFSKKAETLLDKLDRGEI